MSWGSSYGPVLEAVNILNERGRAVNMVHFVDMWPFPAKAAREALAAAKRMIVVEGNVTGQLAYLIEARTGLPVKERMNKYDGRPFTYEYILAHLED